VSASTLPRNGFGADVGDRTFRPATQAQVQPVYHGGMGDMTVDLTQVDVSNLSGEIATRIEHGLGDLRIVVPGSADVQLMVHSGLGSVHVFDRGSVTEGFFPGLGSSSWTGDGKAEFALVVDSGLGDVTVSRG
jgi:predicted membrane protein